MGVVVLNGSPFKDGTVAKLMKEVLAGIDNKVIIDWVDVYELNMHSCMGCMKCRANGKCSLPADDAHSIGKKIKDAEALIIGTPTHWGNMSAPLKMLLDRNVPFFMKENPNGMPEALHKGKLAIIVTACTTPWPFNFIASESRGTINAVSHVLHYGGYKIIGTIVKPGTKKNPEIPVGISVKAKKLGSKLSDLITK